MKSGKLTKLLEDLQLSDQSLQLALRQLKVDDYNNLHLVLWHYDLVSLQQLEQIFDLTFPVISYSP